MKVKEYTNNYNIQFRHPIGILVDQPSYFNGVINKNLTSNIYYSDSDPNYNELSCYDYADIAFLKAIAYNDKDCYDIGKGMFDGKGFKDKAYYADGNLYSTYKLALWKIASERFNDLDANVVFKIIPYLQDRETGGIFTHYNSNLMPEGLTNTETTSLTIMIYVNKSDTKNITYIVLLLAGGVAIILIYFKLKPLLNTL